MRGAIRGWFGCGLVLVAASLASTYVVFGDVILLGQRPPYSGPPSHVIGQPPPAPPPRVESFWPFVESGELAAFGLLLAVVGGIVGLTNLGFSYPSTERWLGTCAFLGGLGVAFLIMARFALEYGSAMAGLGAGNS